MNRKIKNLVIHALASAVLFGISAAADVTKIYDEGDDTGFNGLENVVALRLIIDNNTASLNNSGDMNDVELDAAPFIENDRTYTPARFVAESLGASVSWDEGSRQVTIDDGKTTVVLTIDDNTALVNGSPVTMDSPALIRDGRTYTPARFVAEALGASVFFHEADRSVYIIKAGEVQSRTNESAAEEAPSSVKVSGYVFDSSSNAKLPNAKLTLGDSETTANSDGFFSFDMYPGSYGMTAWYEDHYDYWQSVTVPDEDYWFDVYIDPDPSSAYKKAYAQFLRGLSDKSQKTFELLYIDDNDIPEIAVYPKQVFHIAHVELYTYIDGAVKQITADDAGGFGTYASIAYKERQGLILSGNGGNRGYFHDIIYFLENGSTHIVNEYTWDSNTDSYTWNGSPVSQTTYESEMNKIENEYTNANYETGMDITEANIKSALGI